MLTIRSAAELTLEQLKVKMEGKIRSSPVLASEEYLAAKATTFKKKKALRRFAQIGRTRNWQRAPKKGSLRRRKGMCRELKRSNTFVIWSLRPVSSKRGRATKSSSRPSSKKEKNHHCPSSGEAENVAARETTGRGEKNQNRRKRSFLLPKGKHLYPHWLQKKKRGRNLTRYISARRKRSSDL